VPQLIGPPGVGKTAILEGLASRITAKEVPEVRLTFVWSISSADLSSQSLHNKRVLSIDLSAIMAGSGIRGQFEEKFKALIRDIEDEVCLCSPEHFRFLTFDKAGGVICFIDEVRTWIQSYLLLIQSILPKTSRYALQPRQGRGKY
jgi:ATP-dependent Clp protease ATP-binding subunit ClpB